MDPVEIKCGNELIVLTEESTTVCQFYEAAWVNHIYYNNGNGRVFTVFEIPHLLTQLVGAGFPVQRRRLPTAWDLEAYEKYVNQQMTDLRELENSNG